MRSEQIVVLERIKKTGVRYVIGVDEVGAGCWAGPLVVCAAVCEASWYHPLVRDSKKVKPDVRAMLVHTVLSKPPAVLDDWIADIPAERFQKQSLGALKKEAFAQVIENALLAFPEALVVVDGIETPRVPPGTRLSVLPKADDLVPAVSAASIIAKVYRDTKMDEFSKVYPGYGFERHKGYGTALHQVAIYKLGPCVLHRRSCRPIEEHYRRLRGHSGGTK